jgi:hypothetical protein
VILTINKNEGGIMLTTLTTDDLQKIGQVITNYKDLIKDLPNILAEHEDIIDTIEPYDCVPTKPQPIQSVIEQKPQIPDQGDQAHCAEMGKKLADLEKRLETLKTTNLNTQAAQSEATAIKLGIKEIDRQYINCLHKIEAKGDTFEASVDSTTQTTTTAIKFRKKSEQLKKEAHRKNCGIALLFVGIGTGLIALPLLVCLAAGIVQSCRGKSFGGPFKAFFNWLITGKHHSKPREQNAAPQPEERTPLTRNTEPVTLTINSSSAISSSAYGNNSNDPKPTAYQAKLSGVKQAIFGNNTSSSTSSSSTDTSTNDVNINITPLTMTHR